MSKPRKRGRNYQIQWIDEHGKRRSQTWSNYRDAVTALNHHRVTVDEIKMGVRVRPPKKRTFSEMIDKWLEVRASQKKKPKDDESIIRVHLQPAFGNLCLGEITAQKIAEFSAELLSRRSPQTVKNVLTLLGAMLRQAIEWEWIQKMPKIRKPKVVANRHDYKWLRTDREIYNFLLAAYRNHWPVVYPMYATALYTGMRAGELAGLHWDCVDFKLQLITVQYSFGSTTKNHRMRRVPILDALLPILQRWKLASKNTGPSDLVFPNNVGEMWDQSGRIFQETLREVLKNAGFPSKYITFHSLRHTFASHWVMDGGNLFRLQKILGHSESKTTQIYAHLEPDAYEADRGRLGGAWSIDKGKIMPLRD